MPILVAIKLLITLGPAALQAFREINTFIDELYADGKHDEAQAATAKSAELMKLPRATRREALTNHRDALAYASLMQAGENDGNKA